MTPTPQQARVIDFVANGAGHLVVEALAGTGKTTTIVEALSALPPGAKALFVAFNKSIATTLQNRVPAGVDAMTLHSLGLRAITRNQGRRVVDGSALARRIKEGVPEASREYQLELARLVAGAKAANSTTITLQAAPDGISDEEAQWLEQDANDLLAVCREDTCGAIDFDDMVWLPATHGWRVGSYDFTFVDETQDLNPAQLVLVKNSIKPGGRIIAIGDRHQSIYGFRGADSEAIPRMIGELGATVLPLSVTFRCPRAVVAEAQEFVPELEAAATNAEGTVRRASYAELCDQADTGDLVLSRSNAPLVSLCYAWLREGKPCHIQGRDIGAQLGNWLKKHCAGKSIPEAVAEIRKWEAREAAKLEADDKDTDQVHDRAECLVEILGSDSVTAAIRRCEVMFADGGEVGVKLSSTHRAKGTEARKVWVMRDTYMRRRKTRQGIVIEPSQEERNLLYVAITRSLSELVYVPSGANASAR